MRILKTLITFSDFNLGVVMTCDTIEFQDKFWIVPEWKQNNAKCKMRPDRLICLDDLRHQRISGGFPADFVLSEPIPRWLFDGDIPPGKDIHVLKDPDLLVDICVEIGLQH